MTGAEFVAKAEQHLKWSVEEEDETIALLHATQANAYASLAVAASQLRSLSAEQEAAGS